MLLNQSRWGSLTRFLFIQGYLDFFILCRRFLGLENLPGSLALRRVCIEQVLHFFLAEETLLRVWLDNSFVSDLNSFLHQGEFRWERLRRDRRLFFTFCRKVQELLLKVCSYSSGWTLFLLFLLFLHKSLNLLFFVLLGPLFVFF